MCASDTHAHTPHHSQVDSIPPRSQLHLFSVKDSWGFMTQKNAEEPVKAQAWSLFKLFKLPLRFSVNAR